MADILTGRERIATHGVGPQAGAPLDVVQVRDAAGYSKQVPAPAREATFRGIVMLAGSTYSVSTTGIVDGNKISGLAATDGLDGAAVSGDGIPENTTVGSVPAEGGSVILSNSPPFAPTTNVRQPVIFLITVQRDAIIGLASTDDLVGARVSGAGLPDGAVVRQVLVSAVPATNTRPGSPGEVLLTLPPKVPAVAAVKTGSVDADAAKTPASVKQPAPAAPTAPSDIKFAIPSPMIRIPDNVSRLQLSPAEPMPELAVMLPVNPVDGQMAFIYSTLEIGELTVMANVQQTLNWSPRPAKNKAQEAAPVGFEKPPCLKLAPDTGVGYLYSAPDKIWDRIQ